VGSFDLKLMPTSRKVTTSSYTSLTKKFILVLYPYPRGRGWESRRFHYHDCVGEISCFEDPKCKTGNCLQGGCWESRRFHYHDCVGEFSRFEDPKCKTGSAAIQHPQAAAQQCMGGLVEE
jgi:hypothetical protein